MKELKIGIVGDYQSGKSLLINCLLNKNVASVGRKTATTHTVVQYTFAIDEHIEFINADGFHSSKGVDLSDVDREGSVSEITVYINAPILRDCILIDMPGLGYNESDNRIAKAAIKNLDYAILVASNDQGFSSQSATYQALSLLKKHGVPYYFYLNCTNTQMDKWDPICDYNARIAKHDNELLADYKPIDYEINNEDVPIINLMWYWLSFNDTNDPLVGRYLKDFVANGLVEAGVSKEEIRIASNFEKVLDIFSMDNKQYLQLKKEFKEAIAAVKEEVCPIGTIQAFAFNNIPLGWLICNGASLSISDYPQLYAAIGDFFGEAEEGMFFLPDLRGRFIRGWDKDHIIDSEERSFGSYQNDAIQDHTHGMDPSKLIVSESGEHVHRAQGERHDVGSWGGAIKTFRYLGGDCTDTGETKKSGLHSHEITATDNKIISGISDGDGISICAENRPKNIALQYCIKAESIVSVSLCSKEGISTIKRDIESSVARHLSPISVVLPPSEIGSEEYNRCIETIKKRFFSSSPTHHQELLFVTWRCFREICIYNARMGSRVNGFDEQGLYYLVSWMVDCGFIKDESRLSFIDEVKRFALNLNSNLTPKEPNQ